MGNCNPPFNRDFPKDTHQLIDDHPLLWDNTPCNFTMAHAGHLPLAECVSGPIKQLYSKHEFASWRYEFAHWADWTLMKYYFWANSACKSRTTILQRIDAQETLRETMLYYVLLPSVGLSAKFPLIQSMDSWNILNWKKKIINDRHPNQPNITKLIACDVVRKLFAPLALHFWNMDANSSKSLPNHWIATVNNQNCEPYPSSK